jgi:anti-sigma factor RsiW
MNPLQPAPKRDPELESLLEQSWAEIARRDPQEPDVELIAAYLDGELDEVGETRLARHLAESPKAFSLLYGLLGPQQRLPRDVASTTTMSPTTLPLPAATIVPQVVTLAAARRQPAGIRFTIVHRGPDQQVAGVDGGAGNGRC